MPARGTLSHCRLLGTSWCSGVGTSKPSGTEENCAQSSPAFYILLGYFSQRTARAARVHELGKNHYIQRLHDFHIHFHFTTNVIEATVARWIWKTFFTLDLPTIYFVSDELWFLGKAVITMISKRYLHCYHGELDGEQRLKWFVLVNLKGVFDTRSS